MFSRMMIPMSTIVPIAMAIPANDMMLALTPKNYMAINDMSTAMGNVMATTMLAQHDHLVLANVGNGIQRDGLRRVPTVGHNRHR